MKNNLRQHHAFHDVGNDETKVAENASG